MAETKDFGPLFVHLYKYPNTQAPLLNCTTTQEIEPPYKVGKSVILRLPFTIHAIVLGIWTSQRRNEEEAIMSALSGHIVTPAGTVTEDTLFGVSDVEA